MEASTSSGSTSQGEPSSSSRRLRSKRTIRYCDTRLPRPEKVRAKSDKLFPVKVVEKEGQRVKIHYVGYSIDYDEWREESELESIASDTSEEVASSEDTACEFQCSFEPFSLHNNLKVKIKQSLSCSRKGSPQVKIIVPFDAITFNGGLGLLGIQSKKVQGVQHYAIKRYQDLNPILGKNWHFRGLNVNADYGYVVLETVDFYLRKCRPLEEYVPSQEQDSTESSPCMSLVDTGHNLTFMFVCGYGVQSTFGKDRKVFY